MPRSETSEYRNSQREQRRQARHLRRKEAHFYDFDSEAGDWNEPSVEKASGRNRWYIRLFAGLSCFLALMLVIQAARTVGTMIRGSGRTEAQEEQTAPGLWLPDGMEDTLSAAEKRTEIRAHRSDYPQTLRALAERNPDTLNYVYYYPSLYAQEHDVDVSAEVTVGEIPHLYQWDTRWGYTAYGNGLLGYTGSGPCCLSMVALGLTGQMENTPDAVAVYAEANGYYTMSNGTGWALMSQGCDAFGLRAEEIAPDAGAITAALDAGHPVICSVYDGDFEQETQYIVIAGYTQNGFLICDPSSASNSAQIWPFAGICGQINAAWAYSAR